MRQGLVKARTAQASQLRGLLSESGLIIPQDIGHIIKRVPILLNEAMDELPGAFRQPVEHMLTHFRDLDRQVSEPEAQINAWRHTNPLSCKLDKMPGIGPVTASALVASVGDASNFTNGRQLAAWSGLLPGQHSTGGKSLLLGISKRVIAICAPCSFTVHE